MASLLIELQFWTFKDLLMKDVYCGVSKLYDKGEGDAFLENPYLEDHKSWSEDRDVVCIPRNKRPEKLKDTVKELEELLETDKCTTLKWIDAALFQIAAVVTTSILQTWIVGQVSQQHNHLASEELNRLREDNWDQEQMLSSSSEKSWQMDSSVQKTPPPVPPKPKNYLYSRNSPRSRPPPFKPPAPTRGCSLSKLFLPHVSPNPKFASVSDLSSVVQNEVSLEH